MKYERTYNFSAGPAMMPECVLEEIRDEMMNYRGSGMCVMEMSHRSKVFMQIAAEAEEFNETLPEKPVTLAIKEVADGKLSGSLKEEYMN